mgnify:CR=1 FL=1
MSRPWIEESWRLLLFVAGALLIGIFTGQTGWLLSIGLLLYLGNLFYRLRKLEQWVRHYDLDPPDLDGVFDEIVYQLHRHRKRQHARRSRIAHELRQFQRSARILPDATVLLDDTPGHSQTEARGGRAGSGCGGRSNRDRRSTVR